MSAEAVVSLKCGKVQGIKVESTFTGTEYYAFYGIPYAQPPIGDLRFRDPVAIKPWKSIRDCTSEKGGCAQFSLYTFKFQGTEDCLYVNVYTPKLPQKGDPLKPVVVNIPPGGLTCGSPDPSDQGSPDFVMDSDIVYVCIGHRLHILGFLNLSMEECQGNQGLKDMIMAFDWVKENISRFGGDPENITAFGSSSGATMIHTLILLPAVKPLFHRAVLMGDFIFNNVTPVSTENESVAFEFARTTLGFKGDNPKKLLQFLKKLPLHVLVSQLKFFQNILDRRGAKVFPAGRFLPTMDPESTYSLVPIHARKCISFTKKIPIIYGQCEKEAIFGFNRMLTWSAEDYFKIASRQNCWGWMYPLDDDTLDVINRRIESFYFADLGKQRPITVLVDVLTDAAFSEIYDTVLNPIAAEQPVYVYKFQYRGEIGSLTNLLTKFLAEPVEGTYHFDDYSYWTLIHPPRCDKTIQVIKTFTKLVSNFAKTGNPNDSSLPEEWRPMTPENPCYLSITDTLTMVDDKLNGERTKFWDNLMQEFRPGCLPQENQPEQANGDT